MKMAAKKERSHAPDDMDHEEQMLDEQQLEEIYAWVDSIPISRPKRFINRDFSDGVLVAEMCKHFFDNLVDMHNYPTCNQKASKEINWATLNRKVFSKLNFELADNLIDDLVSCKPGCVEKVLMLLKSKIDRAMYAKEKRDKPEAEQYEVSPGRKGASNKGGMDNTKAVKMTKTKQIGKTKGSPLRTTQTRRTTQPSSFKGQQAQSQGGVPKKRVGNISESDLVPRYIVEEKEQEVLSRDETIQILMAKIDRLEHLLKLKDMKIVELQKTLQSRSAAHLDSQYNTTFKPNQKPRYYR